MTIFTPAVYAVNSRSGVTDTQDVAFTSISSNGSWSLAIAIHDGEGLRQS